MYVVNDAGGKMLPFMDTNRKYGYFFNVFVKKMKSIVNQLCLGHRLNSIAIDLKYFFKLVSKTKLYVRYTYLSRDPCFIGVTYGHWGHLFSNTQKISLSMLSGLKSAQNAPSPRDNSSPNR